MFAARLLLLYCSVRRCLAKGVKKHARVSTALEKGVTYSAWFRCSCWIFLLTGRLLYDTTLVSQIDSTTTTTHSSRVINIIAVCDTLYCEYVL